MDFANKIGTLMSFSVRKREAIANNIANQVTPGYKAEVVRWQDELEKGMGLRTTNSKHISTPNFNQAFVVERDFKTETNSDGNNVDMNREIIEMMKNNQQMSLSVRAVNEYYKAREAARGR